MTVWWRDNRFIRRLFASVATTTLVLIAFTSAAVERLVS